MVKVRSGSPGIPVRPSPVPLAKLSACGPHPIPRSSLCQAFCGKSPARGLFHLRLGNPSRGEHRGRSPQTPAATPAFPVRPIATRPHPQFPLLLGNIPPPPTSTPQFSNALCRAGTPYAPRPPDRRPAGRFRPDTAGLYGGGTIYCAEFWLCAAIPGETTVRSDRLDMVLAEWRVNRKTCAPLSAWYCLRKFGHEVTADEVTKRANDTEKGMSLAGLVALLNSYEGVSARAVRVPNGRVSDLPRPCILALQDRHCIVLDDVDERSQTAVIFERTTFSVGPEMVDRLSTSFTGTAVVFARIPISTSEFVVAVVLCAAGMFGLGLYLVRLRVWHRK